MILTKRRTLLDRVAQSLTLLESEKGHERISAEFNNNEETRKIENRINRAFLFCLKDYFPEKRYRVLQELPRQPESDTQYDKSEDVRPDLTIIQLADDNSPDGGIDFHIECKRLGSPTSSKWKYNEKYVENGIFRFISDRFYYGVDRENGAMVGYIEDMEFDDIFKEVNQTIDRHLRIESLSKTIDWQEKSTTKLHHKFERPFKKSPFTLHHFWVDLRGCYPRSQKSA